VGETPEEQLVRRYRQTVAAVTARPRPPCAACGFTFPILTRADAAAMSEEALKDLYRRREVDFDDGALEVLGAQALLELCKELIRGTSPLRGP
jgi:hypothetical protein